MAPEHTDAVASEEIRNLLGRYAVAVDQRDFDTVGACFAEDATASYSGLELPPGRDAIVEHIRGVTRTRATQHFLLPMTIEVHNDRATTLTYGLAVLVQESDGGTRSVARGLRYADELRRGAAGWEITRRHHTADWTWDLPIMLDPGAMWEARPTDEEHSIFRSVRE